MKFGPVKGDAIVPGDATLAALMKGTRQEWINISHFDWKVDWAVTTRAKIQGSARDSKHPDINEFTIHKATDSATTGMLDGITRQQILKNPKGEDCTIRFLSTGAGEKLEDMLFQEFIFHESLITSVAFASEGDQTTETIKINFTGVEMKVWSLDESNTKQGPFIFPCFQKVQS